MSRSINTSPFARPSLGREEEAAAIRVLRSGWLTTGKEVKAFEEEFADYTGMPYALAVNSATAGLHLSLEALGIREGDTVLTTPFTFTATAEIVRYLKGNIKFIDIDPSSLTIDPLLLERALKEKPKPKAIIPVHLGGHPCDMEALTALSEKYKVPLVEDCAHSFPGKTEKGFLGTLGKAGVFSFYATKTITTGEGGMIVTSDGSLARRASIMRLHGIDRDVWNRYSEPNEKGWEYRIIEAGYKYNLSDLAAAIGREQLKKAQDFLARRKKIAALYSSAFSAEDWILLPKDHPAHSWHLYIIRIDNRKTSLTRDLAVKLLADKGIGTSVHYIPLHIMPYYRDLYNLKPEDFPSSMEAYNRCLSLPIYPSLSDEEVGQVISAVVSLKAEHGERKIHGRD